MSERQDNTPRRPAFSGKSAILVIVLLSLAGVALIFMMGSAGFIFSSELCGQACHTTKQAYQTWKRSEHADVPCYRCHVDPSPSPLLGQLFKEQPDHLMRTLTGDYKTPVNADSRYYQRVGNARCLPCHEPSDLKKGPAAKLRRSRHARHLEAGVLCTDCHNRVAHGETRRSFAESDSQGSALRPDFMNMQTGCWRCHSKKRQWRDDKALDRLNLYSFPPTDCSTCHEGRRRPLTGRLSHRDRPDRAWKDSGHGPVARRDYDACLPCHALRGGGQEVSDCTGCHGGVTMPHDGDADAAPSADATRKPLWIREHADVDSRPCAICHDASAKNGLCDSCHHRQFLTAGASSGSWNFNHRNFSRVKGTQECTDCHMTEFCSYCHTLGKKPPQGTFMFRDKSARKPDS